MPELFRVASSIAEVSCMCACKKFHFTHACLCLHILLHVNKTLFAICVTWE